MSSDSEKEYFAEFQELARQYKAFFGHRQTFRSWLRIILSRYGLGHPDIALAGFKILAHTDLSLSEDSQLLPKFQEFLLTLKRIDSLCREFETLTAQGTSRTV